MGYAEFNEFSKTYNLIKSEKILELVNFLEKNNHELTNSMSAGTSKARMIGTFSDHLYDLLPEKK